MNNLETGKDFWENPSGKEDDIRDRKLIQGSQIPVNPKTNMEGLVHGFACSRMVGGCFCEPWGY